MKFYLLLPLIFVLASCATSGVRMNKNTRQQSLAQGLLLDKIKTEIATSELSRDSSCSSPSVLNVTLVSSALGPTGSIITAREHWKLDRCGRNVLYRVDYYGPIGETTNIHVQLIAQ